jgi:hypothetical protein
LCLQELFLQFYNTKLKTKLNTVIKFLLASTTTLNSKNCSESRIRISVPAFPLSHLWVFSSENVIVGFWKNSQDHRQLSEQFSRVADSFLNAATSSLKRVSGRI